MTRREIVLAAMAAGGHGAAYAPAQIQKLLFLIDREVAFRIGGPFFNFRPYDYGPFDEGVYQELERMEAGGLVEIIHGGRYRRYALTAPGVAEGAGVLQKIAPDVREYVEQAAAWVRSVSFNELVSAIYQRYPEMRARSIFRG